MKYSRVKFSSEASEALNRMKGKTGLTPNILCRIGFCLSLNDPMTPNPKDFPSDGDKEIERQVLTGHWDNMYTALLKERYINENLSEEELLAHFKAHMNRGVLLLSKRVRSIKDLARLVNS
jgi:DNA sulfur modification protein DndE